MRDLVGKTAVITGAGSGIGRALALTFGGQGMNVVVADIEVAAAERVSDEVSAAGVNALAARCDVADRADVGRLADAAYAAYGAVHLLCNNAGVLSVHFAPEMTDADWDWVIGVNLHGVVHGVQAFLPRMLKQGGESHIVNTASIAGLFAGVTPGIASYTTSKYAVVGLSESLRIDLEGQNVGVSVLCPGGVRTQIATAGRNRPAKYGGPNAVPGAVQDLGLDPMEVAAMVLRGVQENALYIFTDPRTRAGVEARFSAILAAYDRMSATEAPR
jgi:NAD(P)-dependent dehydrogenase (short-subunit alcohol dehydrogenase family)